MSKETYGSWINGLMVRGPGKEKKIQARISRFKRLNSFCYKLVSMLRAGMHTGRSVFTIKSFSLTHMHKGKNLVHGTWVGQGGRLSTRQKRNLKN